MTRILQRLLYAYLALSCTTASAAEPSQIESPKQTKIETLSNLCEVTVELARSGATRLHPEYIWATLHERGEDADLNAALEQALANPSRKALLALIRVLELKFIHGPRTSTLDILGPELSHHFRTFDWHDNDFPGGPEGPREQFADVMVDVLDLVRPERRANRSREAVVLRGEANADVWKYVTSQWVAVPGQEKWKLHPQACDAFVRMRQQAQSEGIDLVILSAHRDPEAAQANAARTGNPNAVASFSSHSLGLAIDFEMSHRDDIHFDGLSTRPMSELVRMRESPVHKWLFLRGDEFGWYPYQNEPWHWEYNPPGFRKLFWADYPGSAPQRGLILETP